MGTGRIISKGLLIKTLLLAVIVAALVSPRSATGQTLTFVANGTVDLVDPALAGTFSIGDHFTLVYTFDPNTPDSNFGNPNSGEYNFAITEMTVTVGSYIASGNTFNLNKITVSDNIGTLIHDRYRVDVDGLSGPDVAGFPLGAQTPILQLLDPTATAHTSDALLTTPPDPADYVSGGTFLALQFDEEDPLNGTIPHGVSATVDSICVIPDGEIEKLVAWYYWSILGRCPEPGGAEGWAAEIERIVSLGIDIKEGFIALGKLFFNSQEYLDKDKSDDEYIIDLYETFLGRTPSNGEVAGWAGELAGGLTRNLLLNYFIFSPEFIAYMEGIFGPGSTRPEYVLVNDQYRGFLGRLPDNDGYDYWLSLMQEAQCTGEQAVRDLTGQLALLFIQSAEYDARNPEFLDTPEHQIKNPDFSSEYVTNLYDAILRRGAELEGYLGWKDQYDNGALTKEEVLQFFVNSDEFQVRVQEVIDAGCIETKTVFVTSEEYTGDLGGVDGADQKCSELATAAGLEGTYMAWISDSTSSPDSSFTKHTWKYVLIDGTVLADNWADLTDGTIDYPINITEAGSQITGVPEHVWTATDWDGTYTDIYSDCSAWTSESEIGAVGIIFINQPPGVWSLLKFESCSDFNRLYCFEQ